MTTVIGAASLVVGTAAVAVAVPVTPEGPREGGLVEAGPTAGHGFPAWYRDSNGLRLEACTTLDDPLCSTLPDEVPNPDVPVSYPDNFPGEFFYQLAGATVTAPGLDLTVGMDLEGAWANEEVKDGDQMVFGRIRIRAKDVADGTYRVTHPYGVDLFENTTEGINYTQDIGTTPGAFGQAMTSRVGPFLQWDPAVAPAAPAGYVGDPGVEHKVIGSPYGTNFVLVERKDEAGSWVEMGRTDTFTVQGRKATNGGVDVDAATYRTAADGSGFVDVYASSDSDQSVRLEDAGLGFGETTAAGSKGKYHVRVATTAAPDGKQVTVVNASDTPVASKTATLKDVVTVTKAEYDADADTLTVQASSSDQDASPGVLSVRGQPFDPTTNTATLALPVPTATVTVTSDKGGSTTVPISVRGAGMTADLPVAVGFASPEAPAPGQRVVLTGTGSTGQVTAYTWRQVAGTEVEDVEVTLPDGTIGTEPSTVEVPVTAENQVTLTANADGSVAEFTAPQVEGPLAFELVVEGPGGTSVPLVVPVNVVEPTSSAGEPAPVALTADAGPDQTVRRGTTVALDGSGSTRADTYSWVQVPSTALAVTLAGANTDKPTFTFPLMPLPTGTTSAGNPGYAVTAEPVRVALTVTGAGVATATDEVVVRPQPETLTITAAEFRTGREWRVSGTSTVLAGQRVAVVMGDSLTGRVLGYTNVEAAGAFSFRGAGTITPPSTTTTVSAVSAMGDDHTGFVFRRK